jgi:hypothetical protein
MDDESVPCQLRTATSLRNLLWAGDEGTPTVGSVLGTNTRSIPGIIPKGRRKLATPFHPRHVLTSQHTGDTDLAICGTGQCKIIAWFLTLAAFVEWPAIFRQTTRQDGPQMQERHGSRDRFVLLEWRTNWPGELSRGCGSTHAQRARPRLRQHKPKQDMEIWRMERTKN